MRRRRSRELGFAPTGDLALKMLVFAFVFAGVGCVLVFCGVAKSLALTLAALLGVIGAAFSRVK